MLDSTVVALALPSIRHDVDATAAGLQWVMNGYLLAITVFVVTAGRLGDMFGREAALHRRHGHLRCSVQCSLALRGARRP